ILTPVVVAARLFDTTPGCRVLAVASASVRERLRAHLARADEAPTHVLVADPSYGATYADVDVAFRALRGGAALVATQRGRRRRRDDRQRRRPAGAARLSAQVRRGSSGGDGATWAARRSSSAAGSTSRRSRPRVRGARKPLSTPWSS